MDNYPSLSDLARKAEKINDWKEAARLWRLANQHSDAEACELIVEATEKGDAFRDFVDSRAGKEPEVENKEDSIAWREWYKRFDAAAKEFNATTAPLSIFRKHNK
jgi:hypothetical protein